MELRDIPVEGWRRVVHVRDRAARLDAVISVHDASLGPGCGGVRVFPYSSFEDGLADALRLSRAMSFKNALAGIPFGGGKAVIIADPKDKTAEMFRAFGRALNELGGLYHTAEDSGVSERDLQYTHEISQWVGGIAAGGKGGNPSPYTARGVWRGIEASARCRLRRSDLRGLKVAIIGVGAVGMALAELLNRAGAKLVVADVNPQAVATAVKRFDAVAMSAEEGVGADVDVLAPCALGGAITKERLVRLKASIVAGGANNQLATPDLDEAMRAMGVLYAPDYVINAAGVISVGLEILGSWSEEEMTGRIDAIGPRLLRLFERAERERRATGAIADEMAIDVIRSKRAA